MSNLHDFTILYLISHILGDYQLQSDRLSKRKLKERKILNLHILVHGILLLLISLLGLYQGIFLRTLISSLLILLVHFLLDLAKIYFSSYKISEKYLYSIDQVIHIVSIIIISQSLIINPNTIFSRQVLNWILLILVITKPANITFKTIFSKYQLKNKDKDVTVEGAGALIGNLERILSVIFLQLNEIGAIALIYTAKSIARFKQIEENKRFAEYYLIGTLYSILYAIVSYYIIMVL